jgi:heterodisulfide reductase subunit C
MLRPDLESEIAAVSRAEAFSNMCWSCGSCDSECPVNLATNRLRPQKIVRLASLGLMDELLRLPEIWYCISCRRCFDVCPNLVKPATMIMLMRYAMVDGGVLPYGKVLAYRELLGQFQRVRWRATAKCMQGEFDTISETLFMNWLQTTIVDHCHEMPLSLPTIGSASFKNTLNEFDVARCFTCGECSSACPVSWERSVFDARTIFRMANLGLKDRLLESPAIWLCIKCGRCTEVCSQGVTGRSLIESLQKMAVDYGVVDPGFRFRLERANRMIYAHLLAQIDSLLPLGIPRSGFRASFGVKALACVV